VFVRRLRSGPGRVLGGADAVGSGSAGAAVGAVVPAGVGCGVGVGVAVGDGGTLAGAGTGRATVDRAGVGTASGVVVGVVRLASTTVVATTAVSARAVTRPTAKSQPRLCPGGLPGSRSGVAQRSEGGGTARA
jgi:hypothetical protein